MRERETDRRRYGMTKRFPLKDNTGCIIPFNRSIKPDRRLHNLELSEIDCEEFTLFPAERSYGAR